MAGIGILVTTSGATALAPTIYNDGIIGNTYGVVIDDTGGTGSNTSPANLINDDFAFNTIGLDLVNSASTPVQAYVASNIFWENHDQTLARNGYAIVLDDTQQGEPAETTCSTATARAIRRRPPRPTTWATDSARCFWARRPRRPRTTRVTLSATRPSCFPIDPRPGSDGPANFFLDADFQLTSASAAIDNAWEATAIPTDFLGNSQVEINGGLGLPGYGPRDIGAFEYGGTGGDPVGGAFRVVTTSLVPIGGETHAGGSLLSLSAAPTTVTVTFSRDVNTSGIYATDLVLSGTALDVLDPATPTSLTWIDAYTVQFNLTGNLNPTGTLDVALAADTIQSAIGTSNLGYADSVVLDIGAITPPVTNPAPVSPTPVSPTPVSPSPGTPSPSPAPAPSPAPSPKGPLHHLKKTHVVHHPVKPVKHVAPKPKHVAPKPKIVHETHKKKVK